MPVLLRTPLETFHHQETGGRIDLVGAIHAADPGYYDYLQGVLDRRTLDGACVQYEGTSDPTPEQLKTASPDLRARWAVVKEYDREKGKAYLSAGFALQNRAILYRPSWQNCDTSALDVIERTNPADFEHMKTHTKLYRELGTLAVSERRLLLLELFAKMATKMDEPPTEEHEGRYVLGGRTAIALNRLDQQEEARPGSDYVMLWGAGHLMGFRKGLWARNYKMTKRQLVAAVRC